MARLSSVPAPVCDVGEAHDGAATGSVVVLNHTDWVNAAVGVIGADERT